MSLLFGMRGSFSPAGGRTKALRAGGVTRASGGSACTVRLASDRALRGRAAQLVRVSRRPAASWRKEQVRTKAPHGQLTVRSDHESNTASAAVGASSAGICSALAGCCSVSIESCVQSRTASCLESINNAVTRGLRFDGTASERCAGVVADAYDGCRLRVSDDPRFVAAKVACADVLVGTVQPGALCTFDAACATVAGRASACVAGVCHKFPIWPLAQVAARLRPASALSRPIALRRAKRSEWTALVFPRQTSAQRTGAQTERVLSRPWPRSADSNEPK